MRNIQKILNNINEKYYVTTKWRSIGHDSSVDVYKNSDASEILKLLKESTKFSKEKALRFFMNHAGDYIIWNAATATHAEVLGGKSTQSLKDFNADNLRGQLFSSGLHIYKNSIIDFYYDDNDEDLIERFKQTKFYSALEKANIESVEIGMWM